MAAKGQVLQLAERFSDLANDALALQQLITLTATVTEKFGSLDQVRRQTDDITSKCFLKIVDQIPLFMPYMTPVSASSLGITSRNKFRLVASCSGIITVEEYEKKPGKWYVIYHRDCDIRSIKIDDRQSDHPDIMKLSCCRNLWSGLATYHQSFVFMTRMTPAHYSSIQRSVTFT